MSKDIHEFYAVTRTSVYRVTDEIQDNFPLVEKIALKGESGLKVGSRLRNGRYVGVMKYAICLYDLSPSRGMQPPDMVSTRSWGGTTTPITALFLDRDEALLCLEISDRMDWDQRWQRQTREVIGAIGSKHPVFVLGSDLNERGGR